MTTVSCPNQVMRSVLRAHQYRLYRSPRHIDCRLCLCGSRDPLTLPPLRPHCRHQPPRTGVAPATLQDALAEMHAAAAVAAGGGQDNYHQMWGNLLATRDSYFALVGWVDTDQHSYGPERSAAWDKMLAKRGVTALLPAPVEVIRELAGALELKIVELTQARKDQGVTCVQKEAPATQPAKKKRRKRRRQGKSRQTSVLTLYRRMSRYCSVMQSGPTE